MSKMSDGDKKKGPLTREDILKIMDDLYGKSLDGIPKVSKPVSAFADDYLKKNPDKSVAARKMLDNQVIKCTTSGFITGFGGVITLPVTIPANVSSVLYVQMRMIACTAYIGGYDINSDQVQTLVYACLAGVAVADIIKQVGVKTGTKMLTAAIKKIPGKTLTAINQKVGFRFITKFGTKGIVNLGKVIPVVGAVVGGGIDLIDTKIIAKRAYKWFIEGDFSIDEKQEESSEEIIDVPDDE
ncbi:EcsC family protein [Butyrivibrio sp.]|uniref:EcsC family protein n=1 Tax=Butyrivibrio sp. TaxID=28121 RepID=UPI002ED6B23E